jgi:uncharacterized protein
MKAAVLVAAAVVMFALPVGVGALAVPPKPADIPVVDQTNTLTAEQKSAIAAKIADERKATGNQIAVVMIPTLEGDALEAYSLNVAREWGVGQKERSSGVLLLIVKNDRRLRIEVGYGLEGALPDIRANRIIRDRIKPAFQQDDYYGGVTAGVDGIITAIHGEVDPNLSESTSTNQEGYFPWEFVLFFGLMGFSWLGSMLARTKSWWAGGVIGGVIGTILGFMFGFFFMGIAAIVILTILGLLLDKAVSSNYRSHAGQGDSPSWWAGGPFIGGGSSGGGGFGGFGGGGFGGGGASGDW